MKPRYLFILMCAGHIGWAQAEIYKYTDADGHVTYSSAPMKGAKKLDLEPLPASPLSQPQSQSPVPPPARARNSEASPSDFPRVDSNTQKSRDGTRRKILEDELAAEEKLLADARQNLKDVEGNSETPPKKMKTLQEQMSLHKKNVDALKSELTSLK